MLDLLIRPLRFALLTLLGVAALGLCLPQYINAAEGLRIQPPSVKFESDQTRGSRMETTTFEQYQAQALAAGCDEVLVREWAPDQIVGEHRHPFAVQARVVRGEFWLSCEGQTRHIAAGGEFDLALEVPHAERYGPEGATVWVGRRHAA